MIGLFIGISEATLGFLLMLTFFAVVCGTFYLFGIKTLKFVLDETVPNDFIHNFKVFNYNMILTLESILLIVLDCMVIQHFVSKAQPTIQDVSIAIGFNLLFIVINFIVFKLSVKILKRKFKQTKMYVSVVSYSKIKKH